MQGILLLRKSRKLNRKDIIFLGILILAALAFLLWFLIGYRQEGSRVEITVDGNLYGIYALEESQEIPIKIDGTVTNLLVIEDGQANMRKGDCPDQICVNHASVSHVGESIVCLPNRVVVNVIGEAQSEIDSVAK